MTDATVRLSGKDVGAVSWLADRRVGVFQCPMPKFADSGIQLAPIMIRSPHPTEFPGLPQDAFKGLPGMLTNSLPDGFGNAVIDAWVAAQGQNGPGDLNPSNVSANRNARYGRARIPSHRLHGAQKSHRLEIDALTQLADDVLNNRERLTGVLKGERTTAKRSKKSSRRNVRRRRTRKSHSRVERETGEFRSGQVKAGEGFTYWLMKFDGVSNNATRSLRTLKLRPDRIWLLSSRCRRWHRHERIPTSTGRQPLALHDEAVRS